ncbi:4-amino-4-deoxychorismate lyase [Novimethylophilus kurashikiensis]|uniref:4-amino-4-deoxychorismate lyase n=1 Tax=Novimethylophilus kurashikiensis TaxID=1825523 RepID=A0A2R5FDA2_9PROT|nr:hypothetical protein [Novimethylophilus kurashikiensis]GBG14863.1 4-amino-4-deoxychorismate lyase [Novimethylophilus kurashikiensis]
MTESTLPQPPRRIWAYDVFYAVRWLTVLFTVRTILMHQPEVFRALNVTPETGEHGLHVVIFMAVVSILFVASFFERALDKRHGR